MQSRRNIRIKVMQHLYAYEQDAFPNLNAAEKSLIKSVQSTYSIVLYNLYLFAKISQYTLVEAHIRKSKHLPTDEDLNFSTKLSENIIAQAINNSSLFNKEIKDRGLLNTEDDELIRGLFKLLYEKNEYKLYSITEGNNLQNDIDIFKLLYKDIMLGNVLYEMQMEEQFSNCFDDAALTQFITKEFLNNDAKKNIDKFIFEITNTKEQELFASQLFEQTLQNNDDYMKLIEPQLQNWEADRVAQLDMLLMKLTLTEMLHFETIPVKVSINEYIDIAKTYSTPKSKDFINGILDKLMKQLKKDKKILKTGRGLVEE